MNIQWNTRIKYICKWKCMTGLGIQTRDLCITRKVSTTELYVSRPISIHGSRPNYHNSFLTKFLPFKKLTTNTWTYKKYWNHLKKIINTDPIPHLHPCTSTWTRRTCGPKIGFNKEVEINCIYMYIFVSFYQNPLNLSIFDYKVMAYHQVNYLLLVIF